MRSGAGNRIADAVSRIDEWVWGPWMLVLLLGTGAFLMIRLDFLPIRRLGFALRCAVGLEPERGRDGRALPAEGGRGISPFATLATELAVTIGTGNIVGVATAMVLGGPGALLWMVAASVLGLATKLVECTLSVKYRCRDERGEWAGGPMYTLRRAFPRTGGVLAFLFALFAVMASFGMGNMTQSNSIAEACAAAFGTPTALTGLLVTIATILVVLGGIHSIAKVMQFLVPFMGVFYILGTLGVILSNLERIPQGLGAILTMAFAPQAVTGGVLGNLTAAASLSMGKALRFGVSRGVFSNEAGLGAAGITTAAADTKDYIRQGYISMTGVFLDTCVICALTGLAIAASGLLGTNAAPGELLNGTELVVAVFAGTFGEWGAKFVSVSVILFAFATIAAWAYQGEKAFDYLTGRTKYGIWYRFVYALVVFAGAVCSLEIVWEFSDICNGLMAVPNLIGVLALSMRKNGICEEIREYDRKREINR